MNEITRFDLMKFYEFRANENCVETKSIESRFIYTPSFHPFYRFASVQRFNAYIIEQPFLFPFSSFPQTRYQSRTRLHYLIWWRGKLSQDKLPIRSRLARCCSPLGRHFWSTPSRYRCSCTLPCKISERKFSVSEKK